MALVAGCRSSHAIRDPEYVPIAASQMFTPVSHEALAAAMMPLVSTLAGQHAVEEYIQFALA